MFARNRGTPDDVVYPPGPHREDALIREAAFIIAERPRGGTAIWVRNGTHYAHDIALAISMREQPARIRVAAAAKASRRNDGKAEVD